MKHILKQSVNLLLMICFVTIFNGCEKGPKFNIVSYPAPIPFSFGPASGYPLTNVTIAGKDFGSLKNAVTVLFGGIKADTIVSCTDNQIVVQVPAKAISGKVTLKVWTHTIDSIGKFTVIPAPSITKVSANAASPGDVFKISGVGFGTSSAAILVNFNGTNAEVTAVQDTLITVTVPTGFTSGNVTVSINGYVIKGPAVAYLVAVPSPVYQLDFDGNLNATVGGTAATYIKGSASPYSFIKGIDGQAISFAGYLVADGGVHQAVALPTNAAQYNELSVSCWVYHPADLSATYFEPIFEFGTSNYPLRNNHIGLLASAASWWNGAGQNVVARYIYDINGNYQETNSISSKSIPATDWHHMVLTASKTDHKLITYMDGVVIASTTLPSNYDLTLAMQDKTFIAAHADNSNNWNYKGAIDKFQIFNYVLNANQVYTLYYKK